jgi:hypothetical protein
VSKLVTQNLEVTLGIDSLKANPVVSDEVNCGDCSVFLADLTAFKENMPPSVRN